MVLFSLIHIFARRNSKNARRYESKNDVYRSNPELIPSHDVIQAGAGKIDALAGLQKIVGTTAINMVGEDSPRH